MKECDPIASDSAGKILTACPVPSTTTTGPTLVPLSLNCTEPVGVAGLPATVAVRLTGTVTSAALDGDALRLVVVFSAGAAVIWNDSADDVDPEKPALPGVYCAVIECDATDRDVVASEDTVTGEPEVAVPASAVAPPI